MATAAVQNLLGGDEAMRRARTPDVYADAAYEVLNRTAANAPATRSCARTCWSKAGATDLDRYSAAGPDADLGVDLFVDDINPPSLR